jgi:ribosomal protein S28E/S33
MIGFDKTAIANSVGDGASALKIVAEDITAEAFVIKLLPKTVRKGEMTPVKSNSLDGGNNDPERETVVTGNFDRVTFEGVDHSDLGVHFLNSFLKSATALTRELSTVFWKKKSTFFSL